MPLIFQREKLFEALAYFHANVRNPGWLKLLKLVYYLDLIHLRRTGRTVTGLQYKAWERGPVPPALWRELKDPESDIHQHFRISGSTSDDFEVPTQDFDGDDFNTPKARRWKPGKIEPKEPFHILPTTLV